MKERDFFFRIRTPVSKRCSYFLLGRLPQETEYFVSRVPQSYALENVQPTVWQACHQVGDILEGAAAAQKGKNTYFYYHSFKESVKLKKECSGVWSQGWHQKKALTPCYYDSLQPCLLTRLAPDTNTPRQTSLFSCRVDSACWGKPGFRWRKTPEVFKRSKIIFFSKS